MSPLSQFEASWPAISALLDEALSLAAPERASWLEGLIGEPASHREALRVLLASQAQIETDDFLNVLPCLEPPDDTTRVRGRLTMGSSVGPYRLIAEIGQGGMGTVWLAERADGMMNRRVALKLPHIVWGDSFAERLAREREILATLEHEHIARLYDAGIDAHGRPFLAMEHVDGKPIDAHCRAHALPVRERVALLLQVMAAVSHAHSRLVVHRDLKPSNILVTPNAKVKLLDFGIAKLLEGDSTLRTALTELTGRAFTLDYASPEQIRGEPLSTASDVYSLAVVAFEVLTDARPYRLKRGTAAEMEEAIANAEPLLASDTSAVPATRRALRGDLDAILNRALKKSATQRYPNVESFAEDLRRYVRDEPVLARPDSRGYRIVKFVGRHGLAVAMTTVTVTAITVGAALALLQMQVARQQERLARAEFEGAGAVRELYVETLSRLSVISADDPAALLRPKAVTLALRQQLDEMAVRLKDRPRERDAQLYAVALQLDRTEEFEAALVVGRELLASLKAHNAPPVQVIDAYGLVSGYLFRLRQWDECERMRREGVAWSPETNDTLTETYRQKLASGLGSILRVQGKRQDAEAVFTRAERSLSQIVPIPAFRFENLKQFSMFWLGWDETRALLYADMARAGTFALPESGTIEKSQALRALGYALQANGRSSEAEAAARSALEGFTSTFGLVNRNSQRALAAVADTISRQGQYSRSDAFLAEQRRVLAELPGGVPTATSRMLQEQQLENAWLAGDIPAAVSLLSADTALLLTPSALGDNDLLSFWPLHALALAGRPREALAALLAYRQSVSPPDRPTLTWIRTLETQAMLALAAGDPAQARENARSMLAMLTEVRASSGRAYRVAAELAAVAAARLGDNRYAAQVIALANAASPPPFPSRVERAESTLRRAEVFAALGRGEDAKSEARAALADLAAQHPGSPRLVLARRLAGLQISD